MKEITLDSTRCPGIDVCGDRSCEVYLGITFFRSVIKTHGKGLISDERFDEELDNINSLHAKDPFLWIFLNHDACVCASKI